MFEGCIYCQSQRKQAPINYVCYFNRDACMFSFCVEGSRVGPTPGVFKLQYIIVIT